MNTAEYILGGVVLTIAWIIYYSYYQPYYKKDKSKVVSGNIEGILVMDGVEYDIRERIPRNEYQQELVLYYDGAEKLRKVFNNDDIEPMNIFDVMVPENNKLRKYVVSAERSRYINDSLKDFDDVYNSIRPSYDNDIDAAKETCLAFVGRNARLREERDRAKMKMKQVDADWMVEKAKADHLTRNAASEKKEFMEAMKEITKGKLNQPKYPGAGAR